MSLRNRLLASFLAVVALLVVVVGYQLWQIERLKTAHLALAEGASQSIGIALELLQELDGHTDLGRRYLVLRDPAYLARMTTLSRELDSGVARLGEVAEDDLWSPSAARQDVQEIRQLDRVELRNAEAAADVLQLTVLPAAARLRGRLSDLLPATRRRIEERTATSVAQASAARGVAWLSALLGTGLSVALALWLASSVSRPLERLVDGTREIAGGNFEHRVFEKAGFDRDGRVGSPEIRRLAKDFDDMACKLGELDQLKRDFVTAVSHDLKTPLASMQDTLGLVLDGSLGELTTKQRRMLELNFDASERLRQMIMDLLDLARLESGAAVHERKPVDLAKIIGSALKGAGPTLRQKRLTAEIDKPSTPPSLLGDAPLLTQLVSNLVTNAAQAAPKGSTIRLGFAEHGGTVKLWVEDDGPGVREEDRERIFERFQRNSSRRGKSGTGLGLTIARAIAEAHEGSITVETAREVRAAGSGPGARFVVELEGASFAPEAAPVRAAALLIVLVTLLPACSTRRAEPRAVPATQVTTSADADCSVALRAGQPRSAADCWKSRDPSSLSPRERLEWALALLHPANEQPDWSRANELLEQVRGGEDDALASRASAEVLLTLQREVERLLSQLRKLRDLDLDDEAVPPL